MGGAIAIEAVAQVARAVRGAMVSPPSRGKTAVRPRGRAAWDKAVGVRDLTAADKSPARIDCQVVCSLIP